MAVNGLAGRLAYGAVFTLGLPALWYFWAWRLDRLMPNLWPIPIPGWAGFVLVVAGLALLLLSMATLWVTGKGLPMNAYPPPRYVRTGPYAITRHPIYLGFVVAVAGTAIAVDSPAGLWIVTPVSALSVIALVLGYEGPCLRARFGDAQHHFTMLGLPRSGHTHASLAKRLSAAAVAFAPWAILYTVLSMVPAPVDALDLRMEWERNIALQGWAAWPYSAVYPIAIAGPLVLSTTNHLRRFVISAWLITLLGFATMLLLPGRADLLTVRGSEIEAFLMLANRSFDADWLALPSFHVAWVALAAYCIVASRPGLRLLAMLGVVLVGVSCVLTGSHAVVDVVAGLALGMFGWHHRQVWQALVAWSERLANSWKAAEFGPVRVISHATWSGLAAFSGMLVVVALVGRGSLANAGWVFTAGILSAGAWGYWLEGGSRLSRPFGYYGFLFGGLGALLVLALVDTGAAAQLSAAFACGAPLAQAIGRMRCLVQGCCHGRPIGELPGICVTNPKSRVVAMGGLHGVSIHPTQLYSIVSNLVILALLLKLHLSGAPSTLVGGLYLVLSSLARFAEEQYRGEPQTPRFLGLAVYQWLAVGIFLLGILITMLDGAPAGIFTISLDTSLLMPIAAGIVAAAFMSIDFPRSRRRFSRLTVGDSA